MKKLPGKRPLLWVVGFCMFLTASAQFNLEDSEGRTSIGYNRDANLGSVLFNTADQKLKFDYYHYFNSDSKTKDMIVGVAAEGKVANDLSSLFSGDNFTAESKFSAAYAIRLFNNDTAADYWEDYFGMDSDEREVALKNLTADSDGWFFLRGAFIGSKFKRFSSDSTFNSQIFKEEFTGYEIDLGFNYYNANPFDLGCALIFGVSLGPIRSNNLSSLTEKKITDKSLIYNGDSSVVREVTREQSAWTGDYEAITQFQMKADLLIIPRIWNRVGILGYYRMLDYKNPNDRLHSLGAGLYFLKKDTNFTPLGGINIGWTNLAENRDMDREFVITLVTAFNLFTKN